MGHTIRETDALLKPLLFSLLKELEQRARAKRKGEPPSRRHVESLREIVLALSTSMMLDDSGAMAESAPTAAPVRKTEGIEDQAQAWRDGIEQRLERLTAIIEAQSRDIAALADLRHSFNLAGDAAIEAMKAVNGLDAAVVQQRDALEHVKRALRDKDDRIMHAERSSSHWRHRIETLEKAVAKQHQSSHAHPHPHPQPQHRHHHHHAPASAPMRPPPQAPDYGNVTPIGPKIQDAEKGRPRASSQDISVA